MLLFAVREQAGELPALAGLPELVVGGLDEAAALELLALLVPGRLSPAVGTRIVAETGGNPLALTEVARELSPGQLAGAEALPEPLPAGGSLEEVFGRRVRRLPPEARLLLAVAAAEPTASEALLWRAAGELGLDPDVAASADLGGLTEFGSQVVFRHPLVRSAVYYAIPLRQRRLIHQALAAAGDGEEPDRVAWHLGMAAAGPDEAVAARLEQAAGRARERGGYAATVTFLSRAAELSEDQGPRAVRLLAAAEAALIAGQPFRAGALLEEATPKLGDPLARAQARRLQGTIRLALGRAGEASSILLEAARELAPFDASSARGALLEALRAALYVGWSASQAVLAEIADAARAMPGVGGPASAADLLLDGFSARAADGYPASVPPLRSAIAMLGAGDLGTQEGPRWLALGCAAAAELFDDQAQHALAIRMVQLARDHGALTMLPVALTNQSNRAEVIAGRFDAARACFTEGSEISAATGNPGVIGTAGLAEVYELAWRGRETDTRRVAAAVAGEATGAGRGSHSMDTQYCLAVLELGLGNYEAALQRALDVYEDDCPDVGTQVLPTWSRPPRAAGRPGRLRPRSAGSPSGRLRPVPPGPRDARPVPGAARRRRQRRTPLPGGDRPPGAVPDEAPAGPRLPVVRRMAAPSAPPPRRARAAAHRARDVRLDGCRGVRRTGPGRVAGHRGTRPPANRRDRNRAHAAGSADRPAGQPGRQQPGHRRAAVPQRVYCRLPPAEGVPEDRRDLPHPAGPHHSPSRP